MRLSIFVLGVIAITAQSVYIREVLATFRGGELTIGTALLFWLLWTAAGSGIAGRFISRTPTPQQRFHILLTWYGITGYMGVVIIASIPYIARLTPGELVPYDIQFLAMGFSFLPFNILGGTLFSLGVRAFEAKNGFSAGSVFTLEAFGSAAAGVFISILLVTFFPNSVIALICPLIAFTVAIVWLVRHRHTKIITWLVFPLILFLLSFTVKSYAYNYIYTGQKLLDQKDTKYGRLRVTKRGETITFYSDASILFSTPDRETSEYIVHIPMLFVR